MLQKPFSQLRVCRQKLCYDRALNEADNTGGQDLRCVALGLFTQYGPIADRRSRGTQSNQNRISVFVYAPQTDQPRLDAVNTAPLISLMIQGHPRLKRARSLGLIHQCQFTLAESAPFGRLPRRTIGTIMD
jgi:hypothetical protein